MLVLTKQKFSPFGIWTPNRRLHSPVREPLSQTVVKLKVTDFRDPHFAMQSLYWSWVILQLSTLRKSTRNSPKQPITYFVCEIP